MEFVGDFFDEASRDVCVVGAYRDELDGPFSHGEAFTGGRKVLEYLLHGFVLDSVTGEGGRVRIE